MARQRCWMLQWTSTEHGTRGARRHAVRSQHHVSWRSSSVAACRCLWSLVCLCVPGAACGVLSVCRCSVNLQMVTDDGLPAAEWRQLCAPPTLTRCHSTAVWIARGVCCVTHTHARTHMCQSVAVMPNACVVRGCLLCQITGSDSVLRPMHAAGCHRAMYVLCCSGRHCCTMAVAALQRCSHESSGRARCQCDRRHSACRCEAASALMTRSKDSLVGCCRTV